MADVEGVRNHGRAKGERWSKLVNNTVNKAQKVNLVTTTAKPLASTMFPAGVGKAESQVLDMTNITKVSLDQPACSNRTSEEATLYVASKPCHSIGLKLFPFNGKDYSRNCTHLNRRVYGNRRSRFSVDVDGRDWCPVSCADPETQFHALQVQQLCPSCLYQFNGILWDMNCIETSSLIEVRFRCSLFSGFSRSSRTNSSASGSSGRRTFGQWKSNSPRAVLCSRFPTQAGWQVMDCHPLWIVIHHGDRFVRDASRTHSKTTASYR